VLQAVQLLLRYLKLLLGGFVLLLLCNQLLPCLVMLPLLSVQLLLQVLRFPAGPQAGWEALQHSSSICNCVLWARAGAVVMYTSARFLHKEQTATCCQFDCRTSTNKQVQNWSLAGWSCQPGRCNEPAATSTCCNINCPIHMPHQAIQQHSRPT
jgi:hypothetical protein